MDLLEINGLRLRTEIGFSQHEVGKLQEIVVTIQLKISRKAGKSDCVEDCLDNRTLTKDIISLVENKKYNLIEAIAEDIVRVCVQKHGAPWAKVKVHKPNALRFAEFFAVSVERCSEDYKWENVHLLIGSNISPEENIAKVIALLKEKFEGLKLSRAFRTPPVGYGYEEKDAFINMAVLGKTNHDPASLKKILRELETQLGSVPGNKNVPRTIDIDIALWGENTIQFKMTSEDIPYVIPDPDILSLPHVIIPLADLTPDFMHPVEKKSLSSIAVELCGKNFTSYFPIVDIYDANNKELTNGDFSALADGSVDYEKLQNGKIPGKSEQHVALVTGAAKRIGANIATKLHDMGYHVMIHYNTSQDEATSLEQKLNSVRSGSASLLQGNLTVDTKKTSERIIHECLETWGRLDVLVNNAAQFYPTEIGKVSEEIWNDLIQTNMSAPYFLSQAAFPSLKTSNGCIVNMIDIHADRPLSDHSVYCISKPGLQMCTLSLAKEFAPYVRVNAVSGGAILLPETYDDQLKHALISKIPLKEIGDPGDIISALEYLVSSAKYVTGQIIRVDGGRTLNQ